MLTQQEISDHLEIVQVLQQYGRALDEKRFELLDAVFAPEARLRYVMPDGAANDAPYGKWKGLFRAFLEPFYWTSHVCSQPVVELEGDTAEARCRLVAFHVQEKNEGDRVLWTVYGSYRDRLRRTPAGWRIQERHFRGAYTEGSMLPANEVVRFPSLPFED